MDRGPSLCSRLDHGPSLLYRAEVWLGKLTDGGQAPREEDLKAFGVVAFTMIALRRSMFLVFASFRNVAALP